MSGEAETIERFVSDLKERGYKLDFHFESAEKLAEELLEGLRGFDANLSVVGDLGLPMIIVRLEKFIVYIPVLGEKVFVHLALAYKLVRELEGVLEVAARSKLHPILLVYSLKGVLTLSSYLYFGKLLEREMFRILFINGRVEEIMEVVWSLREIGKYSPTEEDVVELKL